MARSRKAVAGGALIALCLAAAGGQASAATPSKGAKLFGGLVGPVEQPHADQVSFNVSKDGKSLAIFARGGWTPACDFGDAVAVVPSTPISSKGKFKVTAPDRRHSGGSLTIEGKFTASQKASGKVTYSFTTLNGKPCNGSYKWTALGAKAAKGGSVKAKAVFHGPLAQTSSAVTTLRLPVSLRISKDAKTVLAWTGMNQNCDNGTPTGIQDYVVTPITKGKFAKSETTDEPAPEGRDATYRTTTDVSGKFGSKKASGTFRTRTTIIQNGTETAHCDSGVVKWTAVR